MDSNRGRPRARPAWPPALGLALLLGAAPAVAAATEGPIRVLVDKATESPGPTNGFVPFSLRAENTDVQPRTLTVTAVAEPWGEVRRTVRLDAHEQRLVSMPLPANSRYWSLTIDAEGDSEPRKDTVYWAWPQLPPLFAEGKPDTVRACVKSNVWGYSQEKYQRFVNGTLATTPDNAMEGQLPPVATATYDRAHVPDDLSSLVGFRAVLLLETPLEELSEPQRRAVEAYTAVGGTLFLARLPESPATVLPLWTGKGSLERGVPYGFGRVFAGECAGFLEALKAEGHTLDSVGGLATALRSDSYGAYGGYPYGGYSPPGPGSMLIDVASVPAGAFALIVITFALVIGPGGFLVRRRFGPAALLAFVPLTSLLTCGGIATYGAAHEGLFTIHAASHTVTLLEGGRAVTSSVNAYYAALAPRQARFGLLEAVLLPGQAGAERGRVALDWTDGAVWRGGLVPSRAYREYHFAAVAPSRARLQLDGDRVQNALGARIDSVVVRHGGKLCVARDVRDGGSATLGCGGAELVLGDLRGQAMARFNVGRLNGSVLAELKEGEYLARLDEAVFAPRGELRLHRAGDLQLVRGKVER